MLITFSLFLWMVYNKKLIGYLLIITEIQKLTMASAVASAQKNSTPLSLSDVEEHINYESDDEPPEPSDEKYVIEVKYEYEASWMDAYDAWMTRSGCRVMHLPVPKNKLTSKHLDGTKLDVMKCFGGFGREYTDSEWNIVSASIIRNSAVTLLKEISPDLFSDSDSDDADDESD
jgi:hypothetical protein